MFFTNKVLLHCCFMRSKILPFPQNQKEFDNEESQSFKPYKSTMYLDDRIIKIEDDEKSQTFIPFKN